MNRLFRLAFAILLSASAFTMPANAQPDPSMFRAEPVPPALAKQIVLPVAGQDEAEDEKWTRSFGQTWVRNVTRPSLYPVLPKNGRDNGKAVIVVPGGGYRFVSIDNEGFRVAERLAARGYTAFVLKYRTMTTPRENGAFMQEVGAGFSKLGEGAPPEHPPAVADLSAAIALLTERADDWDIDPEEIGVIGFSAGARTAIRLIENYENAALLDHVSLIYPPMNQTVGEGPRPDLFLAISTDDPLFRQGGLNLLERWMEDSDRVEAHLYSGGGHGFGMSPSGTTSELWIDQYLAWLALQ